MDLGPKVPDTDARMELGGLKSGGLDADVHGNVLEPTDQRGSSMRHVRAWKIGATGAAVASLAAVSLTLAAGSAVSAASSRKSGGAPKHGAPSVGPGGEGAPGRQGGATLTFTFPTGTSSTPTIDLSSYDFSESNPPNIGSQSSGAGAGKVTFNPLVVTTPLGAQTTALIGDLTGHANTAELVVRGPGGKTTLDAAFTLVALKQFEVSSASGGTVTLTLEYGALRLVKPTASTSTP